MGSCCVAQGAQLGVCDDLEGWRQGRRLQREGIVKFREAGHAAVHGVAESQT